MKSYGEILIGTSFNPSGYSDVTYVKNECAKLINLAETVVNNKLTEVAQLLSSDEDLTEQDEEILLVNDALTVVYESAVQKILEAQMILVKLITLPIK